MDYEEFRWALGDTATIPLLRTAFEKKMPLGDAVNVKLLSAAEVLQHLAVLAGNGNFHGFCFLSALLLSAAEPPHHAIS